MLHCHRCPYDRSGGTVTEPSAYWRPAEDVELRRLHATGLSQAKCAKQMGRHAGTLSTHSQMLGLKWDGSSTAVAVAAIVADNRSKRSALEARLLREAEGILDQLHQPSVVYSFGGRDNDCTYATLDKPPSGSVRDLMNAATIAVAHSLKIAVHDSSSSHDDAKSMLTTLASAMGMAFREGEAVL